MLKKLASRIRIRQFQIGPLSILVNPNYLIRKALWKEIKTFADSTYGDVLDFGCGSKPYSDMFTNCSKYIGIDVEVSGHNHKNSDVDIFYDGVHLPFGAQEFDSIVAFEVFEHLRDPENIIQEFQRVLRPNGKIFITTPFIYGEHEMPYDFQRWTSEGIKHLFEKCGLEVQKVKKLNNNLSAVAQPFIDEFFRNNNQKFSTFFRVVKFPFIFPFNCLLILLTLARREKSPYFTNLTCLARFNQKEHRES